MKLTTNLKKKINKSREFLKNSLIYFVYHNMKIDNNLIFIESKDGRDFVGNMFRIVEELSSGEYGNYKIYVYADKDISEKIKELQKNYNLKIHRIISNQTIATMILEKAKYVVVDSTLQQKYVKREGQIFVETWHGTPLKVMGRDNRSEEHLTGNVQFSFLASDYLIYSNDYTKNKMTSAYMLEDIYDGKILMEGYPRNSVFFNENQKEEFKIKLGFENKEIFAYMPTFKGVIYRRDDEKQKDELNNFFINIDKNLNSNQILLVKLHPFNNKKIKFSKFKHIKPFPNGYETYDILNMADCLITDYSSVFFDFANTKRKIILFNYDEKDYLDYRGIYFPLSDLPFPKVQTVEDLIKELNSPKEYDDNDFIKQFCQYDNPNAVKKLCRHIFNGEKVCKELTFENNKKNILIFAGDLKNNKVTSSLLNLLSNFDNKDFNIYISFRYWDKYIRNHHLKIFDKFPSYVKTFSLKSGFYMTFSEQKAYNKFLK